MPFKNPLYTITNQSNQAIYIGVKSCGADQAALDSMIPHHIATLAKIEAQRTLKIEQSRVDDAQLSALRKKFPIALVTTINTPFTSIFDMQFMIVSDDYPESYLDDSDGKHILAANLI